MVQNFVKIFLPTLIIGRILIIIMIIIRGVASAPKKEASVEYSSKYILSNLETKLINSSLGFKKWKRVI